MTQTEIVLFKELIRETVKSVLKEEKLNLAEDVRKTFAKDLKEIKLLIAKQIKENRERPAAVTRIIEQRVTPGQPGTELSETRREALKNILGNMGMPLAKPVNSKESLKSIKESKLDDTTKSILMQTAMTMTEEDDENLVSGNVLQEDYTPDNSGVHYSSDEVEEAYTPKFSDLPSQR